MVWKMRLAPWLTGRRFRTPWSLQAERNRICRSQVVIGGIESIESFSFVFFLGLLGGHDKRTLHLLRGPSRVKGLAAGSSVA
jgi:hypothetical protein